MNTGEHHKPMVATSLCLGAWKKSISSNNHGCTIGVAAAWESDATGMDIVKAKEIGELAGSGLLDDGQYRGDFNARSVSWLGILMQCIAAGHEPP